MIDEDFECALHGYLQKAELEYRAEYKPEGSCVEWLADSCDSVENIVKRLRSLGFRIKEIVDEKDCEGIEYGWVVTTSGITVLRNSGNVRGLVRGRNRE